MKMTPFFLRLLLLGATLLPLSLATYASEPPAKKTPAPPAKTDATAPPAAIADDELIIKVDGVVCSFCANGLRKGICKLDFVDTKQKGQGISLDAKKQLLTVRLKKDVKADLKKVFDSIRKGGYKPVKAFARGEDGKPVELKPEPKK